MEGIRCSRNERESFRQDQVRVQVEDILIHADDGLIYVLEPWRVIIRCPVVCELIVAL